MLISPAFGQADLTNCERELIQYAGSIQPHGLLLVLHEPRLRIVQASRSAGRWLGAPLDGVLQRELHQLGGDAGDRVRALLEAGDLREPEPLRCRLGDAVFEGALHRVGDDTLVLELEPAEPAQPHGLQIDSTQLLQRLGAAVQRISEAASIGVLTDGVVQQLRDIVGYDRVMVYRFDPTATARSSPRRATRVSNRCLATAIRPPTFRSVRASCTCATVCACWSTCTTSRRSCCRSTRPAAASWTCRCAICAACRRCTCST